MAAATNGLIGIFEVDYKNANRLQAVVRGRNGRNEVQKMHKASAVIIAALRGKKERAELKRSATAAEVIQRGVRKKNAGLEGVKAIAQERWREEALRTVKAFIEAVDNSDVEALKAYISGNSTLLLNVHGVTASYKGLRNFIEKAPQASKKSLRNVRFEAAPLKMLKETFHHSVSQEHGGCTTAEAQYERELPFTGRMAAVMEYHVKTVTSTSSPAATSQADKEAADGAGEAVTPAAPQCIVSLQRCFYRKLEGAAAPPGECSPAASPADSRAAQHRPPDSGEATSKLGGAGGLVSQGSVSLPAIMPTRLPAANAGLSMALPGTRSAHPSLPHALPPLGGSSPTLETASAAYAPSPTFSNAEWEGRKKKAARSSIKTAPHEIEYALEAAAEWTDPLRTKRPDADAIAVLTDRGAARSVSRLPPMTRQPPLPFYLYLPDGDMRAVARDQRALKRHLTRQVAGRVNAPFSLEPAFRSKYNWRLRVGSGTRLDAL